MVGEFAALGSALVGVVGTIILRREGSRVSAIVLTGWRALFGSVFFLTLLPFFDGWASLATIPWWALGTLLVSTFFGQIIGDTMFYRCIATFGVARTMPVVSSYPLVTTFLAVTLLHESLDTRHLGGIGMVVAGLVVLTQQRAGGGKPRGERVSYLEPLRTGAPVWMLLLPVLGYGVSVFLLKPVLTAISPIVANAIRLPITAAVLMTLALSRRLPFQPAVARGRFWVVVTTGLLLTVGGGSFLFLLGIQLAGAARGGALASVGPLFALLLSPLLLHERITRRGVVGSLMTMTGVWLLL